MEQITRLIQVAEMVRDEMATREDVEPETLKEADKKIAAFKRKIQKMEEA